MLTRVSNRISRWSFPALATLVAALCLNNSAFAQREPKDSQEGVEVQTRGPVHEAFAGVVTFQPEAGVVVAKAPPESIEELPPDQKPAGANVAWIPGYWAWDDDRDDFLWISGVWRSLPPGRQWVPGYWTQSTDGYEWTTGYWADAQTSQVEYLPEPPATLDEGPAVEPPSPDQIWIPGTWVWYHGRYAWRPGYWATARTNWVWIPASYIWSPRGYVFVDGYWDYSLNRRGILFAPVFFNAGVYQQAGFTYSPAFAISLAIFADSLFLRPAYGHYYFGDYYASTYASAGFYPWFAFHSQYRNGYDPIFAEQRWRNRDNPGWEHGLESQFAKRRENEGARPPHTLADQSGRARLATKAAAGAAVAVSLAQLAKDRNSEMNLQAVNKNERQELMQSTKKIRDFGGERQKLEAQAGKAGEKPAKESEPARGKLPKSPIAAAASQHLDKSDAPPEPHKAPQPDPSAEPGKSQPGKLPPGKSPPGSRRPAAGESQPGAEPRPNVPNREKPKAEPKPKEGEPPKGPAPKPEKPKVGPPAAGNPPAKPQPKPEPPAPPKKKPAPEPPKGPAPKPETPKAVPPAPGQPPAKPQPQSPTPPSKKPAPEPKPEPPKPDP